MDIYSIIKWYHRIKSPRLKLIGIMGLHVLRKRYLYIALDPSLACNLRCRLCYFSNPDKQTELKGRFSESDINAISETVFHRGLKLQIGCGAEPTTFPYLPLLVKKAKEKHIPTISITTNGNMLTQEMLTELVEDGLNELILSTHGMTKETYEYMMRNARFERFLSVLEWLAEIKQATPALRVRINYTMCEDNIDDLRFLPSVLSKTKPDIIQLRPVQDIGSTAYTNYSIGSITQKYDECIMPVIQFCQENGITCLYPQKENLATIQNANDRKLHLNSNIDMLPYFHLSPHKNWKEEFNPYLETFEQYAKRTNRVKTIIRMLLGFKTDYQEGVTRALNYNIKQ